MWTTAAKLQHAQIASLFDQLDGTAGVGSLTEAWTVMQERVASMEGVGEHWIDFSIAFTSPGGESVLAYASVKWLSSGRVDAIFGLQSIAYRMSPNIYLVTVRQANKNLFTSTSVERLKVITTPAALDPGDLRLLQTGIADTMRRQACKQDTPFHVRA